MFWRSVVLSRIWQRKRAGGVWLTVGQLCFFLESFTSFRVFWVTRFWVTHTHSLVGPVGDLPCLLVLQVSEFCGWTPDDLSCGSYSEISTTRRCVWHGADITLQSLVSHWEVPHHGWYSNRRAASFVNDSSLWSLHQNVDDHFRPIHYSSVIKCSLVTMQWKSCSSGSQREQKTRQIHGNKGLCSLCVCRRRESVMKRQNPFGSLMYVWCFSAKQYSFTMATLPDRIFQMGHCFAGQ